MIDAILATLFYMLAVINFAMLAVFLMPRKKPAGRFSPPLSVIIPAHNEADHIEKTIRAVAAAHYPGKREIIVVDDGSTDGTAGVVKKISKTSRIVRLVSIKHSGKAAAINHGIKKSLYDHIVYIDADSYISRDSLMELVLPLQQENVAVSSGVIRAKHTRNPMSWLQDMEYISSSGWRYACGKIGATYIAPGFAALKKKALLRVGGFSSDTLSEDIDVVITLRKAGYGAAMTKAVIFTSVPHNLRGFLRQRIRWGRGALQISRKHFDVFFSRPRALGFYSFPIHIFWYPFAFVYLPLSLYWMFSVYFSSGLAPLSLDTAMFFIRWVTLYGIFELFRNVINGTYALTPLLLAIMASWTFSFVFLLASMKRFSAYSLKFFAYLIMFPYYWLTFFTHACVFAYEIVLRKRGSNVWNKRGGN